MYNTKIMQIFANPKNIGVVKSANGVGEYKNAENGETIKLSVKVEDGVILDAKFKVFGNALLIAMGSIVTELIKKMNIEDLVEINQETILEKVGEIPLTKLYCIDMLLIALNNMVADYNKKQLKLAQKMAKD